nr:ribonuclease P protein subunit [Candidatus Woesearchaeota archaeon]
MHLKDILRMELIGNEIEIVKAKNPSLKGVKGKIINETKNMIEIKTDQGLKKVIKDQVVFRMNFNDKILEIEGRKLVNRPEDRLKKTRK